MEQPQNTESSDSPSEPIGIQLSDLYQGSLSISPDNESTGSDWSFGFSVNYEINVEDSVVRVQLQVVLASGESLESPMIDAVVHGVYKVANMEALPTAGERGERRALPEELYAVMISPLVGAARMVVANGSRNRLAKPVILPLVNPVELLRTAYGRSHDDLPSNVPPR